MADSSAATAGDLYSLGLTDYVSAGYLNQSDTDLNASATTPLYRVAAGENYVPYGFQTLDSGFSTAIVNGTEYWYVPAVDDNSVSGFDVYTQAASSTSTSMMAVTSSDPNLSTLLADISAAATATGTGALAGGALASISVNGTDYYYTPGTDTASISGYDLFTQSVVTAVGNLVLADPNDPNLAAVIEQALATTWPAAPAPVASIALGGAASSWPYDPAGKSSHLPAMPHRVRDSQKDYVPAVRRLRPVSLETQMLANPTTPAAPYPQHTAAGPNTPVSLYGQASRALTGLSNTAERASTYASPPVTLQWDRPTPSSAAWQSNTLTAAVPRPPIPKTPPTKSIAWLAT